MRISERKVRMDVARMKEEEWRKNNVMSCVEKTIDDLLNDVMSEIVRMWREEEKIIKKRMIEWS